VRLQWARAGVEVETKRYQLSMMFAQDGILYGGKYAVGLFSGGQNRVSQFEDSYSCATISPNGGNLWRLCDTTLDAMLAKAKQTYDPKLSIPLYVDIQRKVFGDAPYMIIALRNEYNIYRDGVVSADIPPFAFFADPMKIDVTK
jgi:ABC-type transport system substrate-binding protein